jgi:hypothetical protein
MTTHRRWQLGLAIGAAVFSFTGAVLMINHRTWEAVMITFVAVFLAEGSSRAGHAHRQARAAAVRAEALARPRSLHEPEFVACCWLWPTSGGRIHDDTHCTRDHR